METAKDAILNGETAQKISVTPEGKHPEQFMIERRPVPGLSRRVRTGTERCTPRGRRSGDF
jgi:hypothetical protein